MVEGKIAEVNYTPAETPGNGIVELRLRQGDQTHIVRLGPSGYLKHGGMILKEGDAVRVCGFLVADTEDDLLVATEIQKGNLRLALRDARGRPI